MESFACELDRVGFGTLVGFWGRRQSGSRLKGERIVLDISMVHESAGVRSSCSIDVIGRWDEKIGARLKQPGVW